MTVAAYLATLPPPTRAVIDRVRAVLRKALARKAKPIAAATKKPAAAKKPAAKKAPR